jgi:hypothetical protein
MLTACGLPGAENARRPRYLGCTLFTVLDPEAILPTRREWFGAQTSLVLLTSAFRIDPAARIGGRSRRERRHRSLAAVLARPARSHSEFDHRAAEVMR